MSKAVQSSTQWHIQQWYMHTICGTHGQCMYMYLHCMDMYMQFTYIFLPIISKTVFRGFIGISLFVHNG
jgi:hypothetical protein